MDTIDPLGLNIDLRNVDTSYPVAAAGAYPCTIKELEVVPKKDDPNKNNLRVKFALTEPAQEDGKPDKFLNPGYVFTNYLPLQQSDNPNARDFKEGIVKFIDAAFQIENDEDRPTQTPPLSEFVGREVTVVVNVDDSDPAFGKSNNVRSVLAKR